MRDELRGVEDEGIDHGGGRVRLVTLVYLLLLLGAQGFGDEDITRLDI